MTGVRAPGRSTGLEAGQPRLHETQLALCAQAAVALLCAVLLLGSSTAGTAFAAGAGAAALGHVLLAGLLPKYPVRLRRLALAVSWSMIPIFVAFSVPAPPALIGLVSSVVVLVLLRPRFGLLRPRARKLWLTMHVGFSVGWLGAAMAMLVLAIVGASTSDVELQHYAYEIMHVFDLAIVIPLVLLSLITGLVMSLGTKWGLVRHWWVLVKFAIALSIPLFAAVAESFWVREAVATTRVDRSVDLDGTDVRLWVCFVVFSVLLWVATALSSYKPWGKTWWLRGPATAAPGLTRVGSRKERR